ncbi:uncharacterized protein LOC117816833 isoform X2 [Notolabrus celidotus]|uniref:uncharacterized protein LOC117816833 isoform X2 n=1 Tax=Notolabrus celidotus TaxID=1203425 RepID=UPI00148FD728|nr:uncharacterized protein LOC117816833 isoform X2 [Notolabrus celidotus]
MGDNIRSSITKVLPDLTASILEIVLEALQSLGVETSEDLQFINETDLDCVLRPVQARKLLAAWKKTTPNSEISSQASISSPSSCSTFSASPLPSCPMSSLNWVDNFKIPCENFPEDLMQCLQREKRPKPRLRREMIRIIVKEMMKACASPSRRASTEIAKRLVAMYPNSLQDVIEGDVVGQGYHSLVKQMQARIENMKRSFTPVIQKRKRRGSDDTDEVPPEKRATIQDTYGCIKWDIKFLPVSETLESQQEKKEEMKLLSEQTSFSPEEEVGMAVHFEELTGVSLKDTFLTSLEKKAKRLLDFLKTTCADKSKRVLEAVIKLRMQRGQLKGCSEDVKDMLLLLLSYFDEKEETLFHYVEETCLAKEVQMESLPVTPCIIVCGSSCYASRLFMLSIDHKVVNDQITDFISAICLMLGSYYCLNIHYPVKLGSTLEFLQRCFFNINPEKGTKVEKTRKKTLHVNPRVLTLIADLSDHEWRETV